MNRPFTMRGRWRLDTVFGLTNGYLSRCSDNVAYEQYKKAGLLYPVWGQDANYDLTSQLVGLSRSQSVLISEGWPFQALHSVLSVILRLLSGVDNPFIDVAWVASNLRGKKGTESRRKSILSPPHTRTRTELRARF